MTPQEKRDLDRYITRPEEIYEDEESFIEDGQRVYLNEKENVLKVHADQTNIPEKQYEETHVTRTFAWVQGLKGPAAIVWYGKAHPTQEGKLMPVLFEKELGQEDNDLLLTDLERKYPLEKVIKENNPTNLEIENHFKGKTDNNLLAKSWPDSKVTLIDWTGFGASYKDRDHAMNVLLFTKNTRLQMIPGGFMKIVDMPYEEKLKQLEYMANTIPSSWEFVDYTFLIENVTRAFTHQLVRTRHASFAQQTMRVLDVSEGPGWSYGTGPTIANKGGDQLLNSMYSTTMDHIAEAYKLLIKNGAAIEDARGILPTNILTNIVMKCNMRTFVELVRKRSSPRVQGEYRIVLEQMKEAVRDVHPWIDIFINRTAEQAAKELDEYIDGHVENKEVKTKMMKLVDQMRSQS